MNIQYLRIRTCVNHLTPLWKDDFTTVTTWYIAPCTAPQFTSLLPVETADDVTGSGYQRRWGRHCSIHPLRAPSRLMFYPNYPLLLAPHALYVCFNPFSVLLLTAFWQYFKNYDRFTTRLIALMDPLFRKWWVFFPLLSC